MPFAVGERIAQRDVLGAAAGRHVILHVAHRVLRARRALGAGIHATTVLAGQVVRAVVVRATFHSLAVDLRIAVITGAATACRPMILAIAFRVDRALVVQDTRIHALAIVARGRVIALAVGLAVDCETK